MLGRTWSVGDLFKSLDLICICQLKSKDLLSLPPENGRVMKFDDHVWSIRIVRELFVFYQRLGLHAVFGEVLSNHAIFSREMSKSM